MTNVATADGVRVNQNATSQYAIHQFKNTVAGNAATFTWIGQSNERGSDSTIHLQIFNRNTSTWEDMATDTTANSNFDITLSKAMPDLTNYRDGSNTVSCRVYQLDL